MTIDVLAQTPPGAAAVGPLARREAVRILRHPAYLVLLAYFCVLAGVEAAGAGLPARETVRDYLSVLALLWFGPATFFAANLVASSARRGHAESQLDAAPTTAQTRTLATCLGVLGPTAVGVGLAAAVWVVEHAGATLDRVQGPAELAAIPVCGLGAGLLGVAVARWLAWPGAPLLVMVGLIAWVVAVIDRGDLRWTGPWTLSPGYLDDVRLASGSQAWHAVYLLGLGLLAAVAALLRYPSYRQPLMAVGTALCLGTLAAYWAQLS